MRITHRLIRPVALLALTLGFPAVALGDAYAGDHCPHHDSLPAGQAVPAHTSHSAHPGHAGHGAEIDSGHSDTHGHEHGGPCNCIGHCVTQVGVALPSMTLRSSAAVVPATPTRVTEAVTQWAAIDPPYLLPYANAPPSLR